MRVPPGSVAGAPASIGRASTSSSSSRLRVVVEHEEVADGGSEVLHGQARRARGDRTAADVLAACPPAAETTREGLPVRTTITLTRRSLLRTGAAATAASLVGIRPWTATPAAAAVSHLRRSTYAGLTGQSFRIGSVDLKPPSVSDLAGAASAVGAGG